MAGLGISPEHGELSQAVARWVDRHCPPGAVRASLGAGGAELPAFWGSLAEQRWLGLAVGEERGGEGFTEAELAVVVSELGRGCVPGPFLPSALAGLMLDRHGGSEAAELVAGICRGATVATVAMTSPLELEAGTISEGLVVGGTLSPVLSAELSKVVLAPVVISDEWRWLVLDVDGLEIQTRESLDLTRPVGEVSVPSGTEVAPGRVLAPGAAREVERLVGVLCAAEAVGLADWCTQTAADHAKVREQFGRPIGQFQGVKHRCADMLLATERARAAAWDASREAPSPEEASLTAAVGAGLAVDAAVGNAKDCIQVLGGIGFTWEHDAHLYLRRAVSIQALLCGTGPWYEQAAHLALGGVRRRLDVALPQEAEQLRAPVARRARELKELDREERRRVMAREGWVMPHWPRPWGRDAGPLEQLVIDEELRNAKVRRPHLQVGGWVLPTLIAHGTDEQQVRWVPATLEGDITWCQLFSEPGAGSDLASLSTKAVRTDGGWLLSGQKVWTTMAQTADWGICLARTDPEAPKHQGITCFLVDMSSAGLDIRPLKELTGAEMFNEVFLSDVFVPDDCVLGGINDGWRVGRTTLANERVSMGSGASFGLGLESLLAVPQAAHHPGVVGRLVAEEQALAVLGLRMTLRALSGAEPGPESSVRKLLGVEHDQRVQEVGLALMGAQGAFADGDGGQWSGGFLANRCLTIAGGTSEVQRNVVAERLLGLPRDP